MYKYLKKIVIILAVVILGTGAAIPVIASVQDTDSEVQTQAEVPAGNPAEGIELSDAQITAQTSEKTNKAFSAAVVVGLVAAVGAISMALAIRKAVDGTARQPEAGSKIQTMLMLGLVFIETAIIYALIVAILIIFVL